MKYLIYLQNSLKRRSFHHLAIIIILTLSMMMPLLLSVYYSSQIFGLQEMNTYTTKDALFSIEGLSESHLPMFSDLPELTSWYEDGIIYLSPVNGQYNIDEQEYLELEDLIYHTASELELDSVKFVSNIGLKPTEETYEYAHRTQLAEWVVAIIALLIFLSSYNSHLHRFQQDIGILRSLGAGKKHISTIFILEFLIIYFIAAVLSIALSIVFMRLLFRLYLTTTHIDSLDWIVYHVNPLDFALLFLLFFLCGMLTVSVYIHRFLKNNIHSMFMDTSVAKTAHRSALGFRKKGNVKSILTSFLLHRSNGFFKGCAGFTALVLSVIVFFYSTQGFNFLGNLAEEEYPIIANIYDMYFDKTILSQEEIADISRMDGIKECHSHRLDYPDQFLVLDNRMLGKTPYIWIDDTPGAPTSFSRFSLDNHDLVLQEHQIAISKNHKYLHYNLGDTVLLQQTRAIRDSHGHWEIPHPLELSVAAFIDSDEEDLCLDICLSDHLYAELIETLPVEQIEILLDDPENNKAFIDDLESKYPQLHSNLHDSYAPAKQLVSISKGRAIISFTIFGLMLAFLVIILYTYITISLYEKNKMYAELYALGTPQNILYKASLRQSLFMCFIGCVCGITISIILILLYKKGPAPIPDPTILSASVMVLSLLIIIAAFMIPVYSFFKKHIISEAMKS